MSWSRRYAGTPGKIRGHIDHEGLPVAIRQACYCALDAVPAGTSIVFETSGHIDAASADFLIEVKTCDAVV
jgi:hypothetical protein